MVDSRYVENVISKLNSTIYVNPYLDEEKVKKKWIKRLSLVYNLKSTKYVNKHYLQDLINKYSSECEYKTNVNDKNVRPHNYGDFINRLNTFQSIYKWFAKPESIDAVECARYGWCCHSVDILICYRCNEKICHEKYDISGFDLYSKLSQGHSSVCLWRNYPSPTIFYYPPILSENEMLNSLLNSVLQFLKSFKQSIMSNQDDTSFIEYLCIDIDKYSQSLFNQSENLILDLSNLSLYLKDNISDIENLITKYIADNVSQKRLIRYNIKQLVNSLLENNRYDIGNYNQMTQLLYSVFYLRMTGWIFSSNEQKLCLSCDLCGRNIVLKSKYFNNFKGHRLYCPWISSKGGGASTWTQIWYKYINNNENELNLCNNSHQNKRIMLDMVEPEVAYKRIKTVLNEAASTEMKKINHNLI